MQRKSSRKRIDYPNDTKEITTLEEREKLRLIVRNIDRDWKLDYEKYKKNNPKWKAQKKISSAKHYQDNKKYYNLYNKLKRKFGDSPGIKVLRENFDKYNGVLKNEQEQRL